MKKREINLLLLNIKLRPGSTFLKYYICFIKMEKRREKLGKSQIRTKRSLFKRDRKEEQRRRKEINKEEGYKKQVFIIDS